MSPGDYLANNNDIDVTPSIVPGSNIARNDTDEIQGP
jgi:hypothetical protein